MPTYEYGCTSCGKELEIAQRIADPPIRTCPACGKETLERLVSKASFVLKGSGWYADGYGKKPGGSGEGTKASASESPPSSSPAPEAPTAKPEKPKKDPTSSKGD
jgi:putative FmdB family regulatory protein